MDEVTRHMVDEAEKAKLKDPYGKKQVNFEQIIETSSALLSYFCMDELEYIQNVETHDSAVIKVVRANKEKLELLHRVMSTPIICSAADGFIFHF